jgi:hypothetical protein
LMANSRVYKDESSYLVLVILNVVADQDTSTPCVHGGGV